MTDEERARAWLDKWVYNDDDDGPNLDRPLEALLAAVRVEEREAMHYVVRPTGDVTTDPCEHSDIMQATGCGGCELALREEIDRLCIAVDPAYLKRLRIALSHVQPMSDEVAAAFAEGPEASGGEDAEPEDDVVFETLSPAARIAIEEGLASAARGEVKPWARDFTSGVDDEPEEAQ